jgi:hypothetical protein
MTVDPTLSRQFSLGWDCFLGWLRSDRELSLKDLIDEWDCRQTGKSNVKTGSLFSCTRDESPNRAAWNPSLR